MARRLIDFLVPGTRLTLAFSFTLLVSESGGWRFGDGPRLPWYHRYYGRSKGSELQDILFGDYRVILGRELP
jgi:hypothetical protein